MYNTFKNFLLLGKSYYWSFNDLLKLFLNEQKGLSKLGSTKFIKKKKQMYLFVCIYCYYI